MIYLIVICASSFLAVVFLMARQAYFVRNLGAEEMNSRIASAPSFFEDFERHLAPFLKISFVKVRAFVCSRKEFRFFGRHFCRLSDYMNGRHKIESNGCKGYWNEVNGSKNNGSQEDKPR